MSRDPKTPQVKRTRPPVLIPMVLAATVLAGCHSGAQGSDSQGGSGAQVASATAPQTPPEQKTEEAKTTQLRLAKEEGTAYQRSLAYMVGKVAKGGGAKQRSGDYLIAYAEEKAEGLYSLRNGRLEWVEPTNENAHLEIAVSDAGDGRFIPYLHVTATLTTPDGRTLGPFDMPFVWHPGLYHYGRNIVVSGEGPYTIGVRIEPPLFQRHDKTNGRRYVQPVAVVFKNARFKTGKG